MVAEAGSDLFTRTVTHALASFQSAVASQNSHLGPVAALFAMLKLPIMALHLLSVAIVRSSRTGAAILAVILALGCCLVAIQFFFTAAELGKPGSNVRALVSFGWMLLALGMFFPLARTPISTLLWLCALGIGAALYVKGALLVVAVLFVLIVMWRVGWGLLQILAGLIGLGLAALWGSGELDSTILALDGALHDWLGLTAPQTMHLPSWTQQPVVLTAGLIGLGLLLALWQVSPASRGLERLLRLAARRVADLARTLCARGRQGP